MPEHVSNIVRFESVEKSYGGRTPVVADLDLTVRTGEFLTLLGPSGSGKTTCLMMLAGFETPTGGEIYLNDRPVSRIAPHRRGIGVVFQNYALFPHMTISENLAFPLKVRKLSRADTEARVEKALDMVRLKGFGARRPSQLSSGQQQRVAVARSLVFQPALVLMDEPLGALDRTLREEMQYEIRRIHETLGITVVFVTHDQSEALTMSDRIAVIDSGRIRQVATPRTLYEEPADSFVARFVGENNRLSGRIERVRGPYCDVDLGDSRLIRALTGNVGKAGDSTTLSLRPERIVVWPQEGETDNVVSGRVDELIFQGDHVRARLTVSGSHEFIVKAPNTGHRSGLETGMNVRIGWSADDCRALDASAPEIHESVQPAA